MLKASTEIGLETIVKLVQNFIDNTFKGSKKVTYDKDAHAVLYSKEDIDALFAANGYDPLNPDPSFGLRVYLGYHTDSAIEQKAMPNRPPSYIGQHTVILVATKNGKDLLNPGPFTPAPTLSPGTALEEGQLCPPPGCDGLVDEHLHA